MSVPLAVYRALRRSVQVYSAQSVPLTGVAGLGIRCTAGDAVAELQRQFREAQQGSSQAADQGFAVLRRLQAQAQVFTQADEHTRQALAQWNALLSSTRPLVQRGGALAVATAVESGAMLVHKLHCDVTATPVGIDADSGDTAPSAAAVLDDLASTVRQQLPGGAQAREVHHDVDCQANMLHTLGKVLFQELRFRQVPFEWVYDGLSPLLLPDVLQTQKGMSLSLAVLGLSVGHRLGLPLLPIRVAPKAPVPTAADAMPTMPRNAALRAAKHAKRAGAASAPSHDTWLLGLSVAEPMSDAKPRTSGGNTETGGADTAPDIISAGKLATRQQSTSTVSGTQNDARSAALQLFLDPLSGQVVSAELCSEVFPGAPLKAPPDMQAVVDVWAEHARVAMIANQRRGDGDAVAFWLYQLLALDPNANEWGDVMPM